MPVTFPIGMTHPFDPFGIIEIAVNKIKEIDYDIPAFRNIAAKPWSFKLRGMDVWERVGENFARAIRVIIKPQIVAWNPCIEIKSFQVLRGLNDLDVSVSNVAPVVMNLGENSQVFFNRASIDQSAKLFINNSMKPSKDFFIGCNVLNSIVPWETGFLIDLVRSDCFKEVAKPDREIIAFRPWTHPTAAFRNFCGISGIRFENNKGFKSLIWSLKSKMEQTSGLRLIGFLVSSQT